MNEGIKTKPNHYRFGAAFLVRVGQLEAQLYDACLGDDESDTPDSSGVSNSKEAEPGSENMEETDLAGEREAEIEDGRAGLYGMLFQLCSELHKHLRPRVFHGTDMDTLCEVRESSCAREQTDKDDMQF